MGGGQFLHVCLLLWFHLSAFTPASWVRVCESLSPVQLFATLWTVAHQAPPSIGFSRQEYWSGLPFPSPGDLLDPEIKPETPALAGGFCMQE